MNVLRKLENPQVTPQNVLELRGELNLLSINAYRVLARALTKRSNSIVAIVSRR